MDYLFRIIPQRSSYITKSSDEVSIFKTKHNVYKNSFFPNTTIEWNNLNQELKNSECYTLFCYSIINFIRSPPYSFYSCQNITHIKLVIRLRLGLSHLREYKFKHSFEDTFNPLCNCGMGVGSSAHFLLQYSLYINKRCTIMSNLNRISPQIPQTSLQLVMNTLHFGKTPYSDKKIHILLTLQLTTFD